MMLCERRSLFALKLDTPTASARPCRCTRAMPSTKESVAQLLMKGKPGQWIWYSPTLFVFSRDRLSCTTGHIHHIFYADAGSAARSASLTE